MFRTQFALDLKSARAELHVVQNVVLGFKDTITVFELSVTDTAKQTFTAVSDR
jgi:hypothetical protein